MDKEKLSLETLKRAYILLLNMPDGVVRARNQAALAALRDAIAKETGHSQQVVQESFEAIELELRMAA